MLMQIHLTWNVAMQEILLSLCDEKQNNVTIPPSNKARKARIRKGAVFPTYSYITLPNGGPTVEHTIGCQLQRYKMLSPQMTLTVTVQQEFHVNFEKMPRKPSLKM